MSKRFLTVFLALVMTLGLLPCWAAEAGLPFSDDAAPTVCDTERGTIAYAFFSSAVYFSEDGATWTDLSDRSWVREARSYIALTSLGCHREFQFVWTGTEYMMRQDLRDDPRPTHQRYGDAPRNNLVTFLDEDFQIIGELPFDHPVENIRYEDGSYYATVGGVETAFTREEWLAGKLNEVYTLSPDTEFTDVADTDWFAPYVDVCVEAGLMVGVGDGLFAPEKTLSWEECVTLAARLHQIGQGGNGILETPPYGCTYAVLTDAQTGETLSGNYLDREATSVGDLRWRLGWVTFGRLQYGLGIYLVSEEDQAWGRARDGLRVTVSLNGVDYPGHLYQSLNAAYFSPDQGSDFGAAEAMNRVHDDWFMDTWYYVQKNKLGALFQGEDARLDFAHRIAAVTDLSAINQLDRIPDTQDPDVLKLYRGGILNGVDEQGTFMGAKTLTRAEAAAMLARVLEPELRLSFQLESAPQEYTYTLTYLMDDPMETYSHKGVTYPVLPLVTEDGINNGILTLDGELLPWPGGEPPMAIAFAGECLYLGFWFTLPDGSREARGGLIDKTGTFVVPLAAQQYNATPIGNGRYLAQVGSSKTGLCTLWDSQGNATELGSMDWQQAQALYHAEDYVVPHGLDIHPSYSYDGHYVDASNQWVSQYFDWVGRLTEENTGFVGLEGKIYRIEFAR